MELMIIVTVLIVMMMMSILQNVMLQALHKMSIRITTAAAAAAV